MNAISSHRGAASRGDGFRAASAAPSKGSSARRLFVRAANKVSRAGHQLSTWGLAVSLTLLSGLARAQAAPVGGAVGTTADFTAATAVMQAFVNFMTGPFGKAAVVISIVAAFITWVFAPKEGIFGPILRVVVAGIAIMNAAAWIGQFGGAGGITL